MRTFLFLCFIAFGIDLSMGAVNNAQCPAAQPLNGSVCSIPASVSCKYKPFTCVGSPTKYLSRCSCTSQGKYKCVESKPPICKCPGTKPTRKLPGRCTLGTTCRYEPVSCLVGVKFATNCECIATKSGINRYVCAKRLIKCRANDLDCPATMPEPNSPCNPSIVRKCNYEPYGCPGGKPGSELFINQCKCDPSEKRFLCYSASMLPCDED